jgi:hypothetical protein
MEEDGGFVIFSGNKLWYSSKKNTENLPSKQKNIRGINKTRNAAKNKRVIEYPIFEEIMNLQKDNFWISFFDECATGRFPRGFKYGNNILYYRVKNKNIETLVPEEPLEAEIVVKRFIYENAGIISPIDLNEKREAEEQRIASLSVNENIQWISIRNDKDQSIILSSFIDTISESMDLSNEESKSLYQIIKLGIYSGFLTSDNIVMSGGNITEIIGLEFNADNRKFLINEEVRKNAKTIRKIMIDDNLENKTYQEENDPSFNKKCLVKRWGKYVSELNIKKRKI